MTASVATHIPKLVDAGSASSDRVEIAAGDTAKHSGTEALQPRRSRNGLLPVAALGLGAIASVGGYEAYRGAADAGHQAAWGTLSAPAFLPRGGLFGEGYTPYGSYLLQRRERLGERSAEIAQLSTEAQALIHSLQGGAAEDPALRRREVIAFLDRVEEVSVPPVVPTVEPIAESSARLEREHGPVEGVARAVFEEATGKALPSAVRIERGALAADRAAEAHEGSGHVTYAGIHYGRDLEAILHEFGHLTAQVGETARSESLLGLGGNSLQVSAQEEAAAFLFSLVAAEHIADPELRAHAEQLDFFRLEEYLRGVDTDHAHNWAIAIADAAIEVFGSPEAAYRHVATSHSLDPRIEGVIERNRLLLQNGPGIEELPGLLIKARLELDAQVASLRALIAPEAVASRSTQSP
ncbi:MAG: hypothetical protein QY326_07540 [Bdellovibrionota bacterium]|nr:MAG: hypothetical protein QY326_07540 [Bdellovibrionota bacterium]